MDLAKQAYQEALVLKPDYKFAHSTSPLTQNIAQYIPGARLCRVPSKSGEGMALKIFTGAKPFLKAGIKPFGITEIEMLTFCVLFLIFLYHFYIINMFNYNIILI
jgi:hypothetical protein